MHDLMLATGMSPNTMIRMHRNEPAAFSALDKVHHVLGCSIGDALDYLPDENGGSTQ